LKLSVKGDKDQVITALNKISRITKIEGQAADEGIVNLTLYFGDKDDIREEVFYTMCELKTPILELQTLKMSLEDIFLKVTNHDGEAVDLDYSDDTAEEKKDTEEVDSDAGDL
jgi:ABC-2 type transport system ATP-binding protein